MHSEMCQWFPISFVLVTASALIYVPFGCGITLLKSGENRRSAYLLILSSVIAATSLTVMLVTHDEGILHTAAEFLAGIAGVVMLYGYMQSPRTFTIPVWSVVAILLFVAICVGITVNCLL